MGGRRNHNARKPKVHVPSVEELMLSVSHYRLSNQLPERPLDDTYPPPAEGGEEPANDET